MYILKLYINGNILRTIERSDSFAAAENIFNAFSLSELHVGTVVSEINNF